MLMIVAKVPIDFIIPVITSITASWLVPNPEPEPEPACSPKLLGPKERRKGDTVRTNMPVAFGSGQTESQLLFLSQHCQEYQLQLVFVSIMSHITIQSLSLPCIFACLDGPGPPPPTPWDIYPPGIPGL